MPTSCQDFYRQLHDGCGEALTASFTADTNGLQASSHSFITDLEKWYEMLRCRPESTLIRDSLREYQFALLAVLQAQYRQAFMALRLSFELLLATVYFSANEFQFRLWLRGEHDLNWQAIIERENGILSTRFVTAFFEGIAEEAPRYRAIAEAVYRECSQYVHGNAPTSALLPSQVTFELSVFHSWHAKARTIRLVSSFALSARYLGLATEAERLTLEGVLLDNVGHIPAIRRLFGASTEQGNV